MRILMLTVAVVTVCAFGQLNATNYYMSPNGNDTYAGTFAAPWATFAQAVAKPLHAGDTLFVMGGTYTAVENWYGGPSGNTRHPIVIKAYGDAVATFTNSGTGDNAVFFEVYNFPSSHIVIDGESHLKHSPYPTTTRFLVFNAPCYWGGMFMFENFSASNMIHGLVVRNCEIDGSSPANTGTSALYMVCCDSFLVENNYMHHTQAAPTGGEQSSPDLMWLMSCSYGTVRNNIFEHGNHALIDTKAPYGLCRYITFSGNIFNNGWGGGLYLQNSTAYCLVDGNLFLHSGESTNYPKPAIEVNGSHNTIRRNVFYNPKNIGLSFEGVLMCCGYGSSVIKNNFIYNNTFFHNGLNTGGTTSGSTDYGMNISFLINNNGGTVDCVENNGFYNNLLYKANGPFFWYDGGPVKHTWTAEIVANAYYANTAHDWVHTPWGGNKFKNNLLRYNSRGALNDSILTFLPPLGGYTGHGLRALQSDGSGAWVNNIGGDPKLVSESPDTYGTGWWYLQPGSAAIDSGIAVVDSNGIVAEAAAPGYGWGNLTHSGAAPDIGAYEFNGENPSPPTKPPLSSFPGKRR